MFVDSSFWVGLVDGRDQWHPRARELAGKVDSDSRLLDVTACEALTIIGARLGGKAAARLFDYLQDSCEIVFVDRTLLEGAMRRHLTYDGRLSVADCATVEAMTRFADRSILSFDSDFDRIKGLSRIH